ncbi:hypothetical protein ACWCSH_10685, partial [Streptosporangium sp. NPDC001682]
SPGRLPGPAAERRGGGLDRPVRVLTVTGGDLGRGGESRRAGPLGLMGRPAGVARFDPEVFVDALLSG